MLLYVLYCRAKGMQHYSLQIRTGDGRLKGYMTLEPKEFEMLRKAWEPIAVFESTFVERLHGKQGLRPFIYPNKPYRN